jgi:hypothetical protein
MITRVQFCSTTKDEFDLMMEPKLRTQKHQEGRIDDNTSCSSEQTFVDLIEIVGC